MILKNIYLIVGASGSGKTTIVGELETLYGYTSIQSYTTRPPRHPNEKGHIFVSHEEFDKLTDIVAYTEFNNNKYCATADQVDENDLYVIDPKGVDYFKIRYHGDKGIKVIYIDSELTARYERMKDRHMLDGDAYLVAVSKSLERIVHDAHEFYDYVQRIADVDFIATNSYITVLDTVVERIHTFIEECESE